MIDAHRHYACVRLRSAYMETLFVAGYGWLGASWIAPTIPNMDGAPRKRLYKKQPWPPAAKSAVRKRLRRKTTPAAPLGGQSVEAAVATALADETAADGDLIRPQTPPSSMAWWSCLACTPRAR